MLIVVALLFGSIFGWKAYNAYKINREVASMHARAVTVSTMSVNFAIWQPTLKSVGSLRAVLGVNITTELAGMVQKIYFSPGSTVKAGDLLVQLNADTEIGQLHSLQAQVELAKITHERDKLQYAIHGVSLQTVQVDEWNLKSLQAQVAESWATVQKKALRAPFSGRLGISMVNPGQYLNNGDPVTSLQTCDPIYVDFYLPQQVLASLKLGQVVTVSTDTFPGKRFKGKITTIEPKVDTNTRNIEVEATIANPTFELTPGMFASVDVGAQKPIAYLTLPQSAISFNSYGEYVFVVKMKHSDIKHPVLFVEQTFITTGATRGDQIAILKGLKEGDIVVASGQLKLKNGSVITINNSESHNINLEAKIIDK